MFWGVGGLGFRGPVSEARSPKCVDSFRVLSAIAKM